MAVPYADRSAEAYHATRSVFRSPFPCQYPSILLEVFTVHVNGRRSLILYTQLSRTLRRHLNYSSSISVRRAQFRYVKEHVAMEEMTRKDIIDWRWLAGEWREGIRETWPWASSMWSGERRPTSCSSISNQRWCSGFSFRSRSFCVAAWFHPDDGAAAAALRQPAPRAAGGRTVEGWKGNV